MLPAVSSKILEYLNKIDERGGKAKRMDFLRIAGNEVILDGWIEYLHGCHLIVDIEDGGNVFFEKTDAGNKLHEILKLHPFVGTLFEDLSRARRQRREKAVQVF